jgi:signal transduction histidine kinase/streptogramin lyase
MRRLLLAIPMLFLCLEGNAQFQKFSSDLFFNRFTTDDGLSEASVNAILRDSKGFVWLGTDDGLNRLDGNQFKIFKREANDSSSIIGNKVHALWEDNTSRLWVGTSEGLSIYDPLQERFHSYMMEGYEFYSALDFKPDLLNKRVWIAGGMNGLLLFDLQRDTIVPYASKELENVNVFKIEKTGNTIYIGTTTHGLLALNLETQEVKTIDLNEKSHFTYAIRSILAQDNIVWVGTEGDGLKRLDTQTGAIENFNVANKTVSDDKIWALAADPENIWIGTDGGGLTILNKTKKTSTFHKHSYYNVRSLSSNTIRSIRLDKTGDIWFGTFNGGVSYLPSFTIKFHSFRKEPELPFSLPHNAVLSFCEKNDGSLLIGTDGGGLVVLKDGKFTNYSFPPSVKKPMVILTIKETRTGDIYLGTYQDGLYRISAGNKVTHFMHDPMKLSSITSNIVWDIEEDDDGNLWFATETGLNRLYPWDDKFTNYRNKTDEEPEKLFTSDFTQSILLDSAKTLWVGYFGNLQSYYVPTGRITEYRFGSGAANEIPNKLILSLNLDVSNKKVIWFSSFGGALVRFNTITKKFTQFTEEGGLPNNLIYAVQSDHKGIVWFTCNKGLVRFDPKEKSYYVFDKSFGVNTAPFKDNASAITSSGYVLFGGTNGFTAFWPGDINFQKRNLDVVFTGFSMFNQDVPINGSVLKTSITETSEINIPYDKARFLNFQFAVPNFLAPSTVQYQYMLEGFENSWNILDNKSISFTNLLPGNYRLKVKAGFPSGIWGEEKVLVLRVVPPWWMRWYSRVMLIIFIMAFAYGFFLYRTYRLNKRKAELETIVAKQNLEILEKNKELAEQNDALSRHNQELLTNRETISVQNKMLFDAQEQLKSINHSLEQQVQHRTEKLNDTISQLNKTIRELDAFLYSASHDLVSPLKSILGLVNLAKKENSDRGLDHYFDHIERSVKKLEAIIHTLMQHSFNTKTQLNYESVDLRTIIEESLLELKFLPDTDKINFDCSFEKAAVVIDVHRFKIILSNLLSNTVKYYDAGKKEHNVALRYSNGGNFWKLEIEDNGIGIERSRLPKVFDLFYRATESAKGSGLGLYIVKDTMERLGGTINVESEIGRWTRFTLTMPVRPFHSAN